MTVIPYIPYFFINAEYTNFHNLKTNIFLTSIFNTYFYFIEI